MTLLMSIETLYLDLQCTLLYERAVLQVRGFLEFGQ